MARSSMSEETKLEIIEAYQKGCTLTALSKQYGCKGSTISKLLKDRGIAVKSAAEAKLLGIPEEFRELLKNREWLEENYVSMGAGGLTEYLGVSKQTLLTYMDACGAERPNQKESTQRHMSADAIEKFNNPEWLEEQFKTRTAEDIAQELGVHKNSVHKKMRMLGVDRSGARSKPRKQTVVEPVVVQQTRSVDEDILTDEELIQYYDLHHHATGSDVWLKKKDHDEYKRQLEERVPFLKGYENARYSLFVKCIREGITEIPKCVVCGGDVKSADKTEFRKTCSRVCNGKYVAESQREVNMALYGVEFNGQRESAKAKAKETNIAKYGTDHPMKSEAGKKAHKEGIRKIYGVDNVFSLESTKQKIKETNLEKYGVEHPMHSEEIKQRVVDTNIERYGVANPMQNSEIREKAEETNIARYGHASPMKNAEVAQKVKDTMVDRYGTPSFKESLIPSEVIKLLGDKEWMQESYNALGGVKLAELLGVDGTTVYARLQRHGIEINPTKTSAAERQIFEFVKSLGFDDAIQSDREVLGGKELDIVIPSKKIAIEFDGLHWHSAKYKQNGYHLDKTLDASDAGYRLIHIFEDEWEYRNQQVKDKIKSILGVDDRQIIHARKCEHGIVEDTETIVEFYETNHIQGTAGQTITFSLSFEGSVVAMMSFKKRSDEEYELNRFATSARVSGGFSKILKYAKTHLKELGVSSLISFADMRYSTGNLYETTGWTMVDVLAPDYQYVIGDRRVRKQNFRRKYLPERLDIFDPELSERDNMLANGIYQIYDCGLMKFSLEIG